MTSDETEIEEEVDRLREEIAALRQRSDRAPPGPDRRPMWTTYIAGLVLIFLSFYAAAGMGLDSAAAALLGAGGVSFFATVLFAVFSRLLVRPYVDEVAVVYGRPPAMSRDRGLRWPFIERMGRVGLGTSRITIELRDVRLRGGESVDLRLQAGVRVSRESGEHWMRYHLDAPVTDREALATVALEHAIRAALSGVARDEVHEDAVRARVLERVDAELARLAMKVDIDGEFEVELL